jgi:hypothetical protein
VPKRKIKEGTPKKNFFQRIGKKDLLLPPIIIGAAVLFGLVFTQVVPPPEILSVCLKAHSLDSYNVYPRVLLYVDNKHYLFPDTVGKQPKDGKECMRPIHTDSIGDTLHVQYIRPVQLSLPDLMKIYSYDNKTIEMVDNSSGKYVNTTLELSDYDIRYSYYSDKGEFTTIINNSQFPPFSNTFLGRIDFISK